VAQGCRTCGSPTRLLEVAGNGHAALFLPLVAEEAVGDDFSYDGSEPRWLCRFIDAHACTTCGAADLAPHDAAMYLGCDGPHLPTSPLPCPACGAPCLGEIAVECFGVGEPPLAYLAPKFGAPLAGRVCGACGRLWLSLHADDTEARRELATRIPDGGPCGACGRGRLRRTRVDVTYSGFAGLYEPTPTSAPYGDPVWAADLLAVVCDSCGAVQARAEWLM